MSVFGALNRFISRLDSDGPNQAGNSRHAAAGFQVLRNKKSDIPIEPWYDFIVGINGRLIVCTHAGAQILQSANRLAQDNINPHLFATEIRNCAGSSVTLTVWNAKVCHRIGAYKHGIDAILQVGPATPGAEHSCSLRSTNLGANVAMGGSVKHGGRLAYPRGDPGFPCR